MLRILLLLHRYLGIAFGWLVVAWCVSGFVMLYVRYPELDGPERLRSLPPLELSGCCLLDMEAVGDLDAFTLEMLAGRPVLRAIKADGSKRTFGLDDGRSIDFVDEASARAQALAYFRHLDPGAVATLRARVARDQWTVAGNFDSRRPFYVFSMNDAAGHEVYVSSVDGALVQDTTRHERAWNLAGSVVHWLYPTALRASPALWSRAVIGAALAGIFLAGFGLYVAIRQLRGNRPQGLHGWHHWSGLFFGVFLLAWLTSGLLSMNPWGLLESGAGRVEFRRYAGRSIGPDDLHRLLVALPDAQLPAGTRRLESVPAMGLLGILASNGKGQALRLDPVTLAASPLPASWWRELPARIAGSGRVVESGWLMREDDYFYGEQAASGLPVFRTIVEDGTHYYVDGTGGQLLRSLDRQARRYRWWFSGLHRGDFTAWSRTRPLKDVLLLPLLTGSTAVAFTGLWLAVRRRRHGRPAPQRLSVMMRLLRTHRHSDAHEREKH